MQLTNWQWHCTSHLLRHFCSLYFLLSRLYIFLDKKGKSLQEWSRCVQFLFCFFFIFFESKRFKLNSRRMISFQLGNSKSTTVLYGDANHFVLFTVPHFTSSAIWFYRRWKDTIDDSCFSYRRELATCLISRDFLQLRIINVVFALVSAYLVS